MKRLNQWAAQSSFALSLLVIVGTLGIAIVKDLPTIDITKASWRCTSTSDPIVPTFPSLVFCIGARS